MKKERSGIGNIPAIFYGEKRDKLFLYVHGKNSSKEEAEDFARIVTPRGYQVLSFDLPEHGERKTNLYKCSVQNGTKDLEEIYSYILDRYANISLYACSLGAYFGLIAYRNYRFEKCLFVSPILDMEKLITNMMAWAGVTDEELRINKTIETFFGETLSWDYYRFVKEHPVDKWDIETFILYGEKDNFTERNVLDSFRKRHNCHVRIQQNGEHHFHTAEQLAFPRKWIEEIV